MTDLSAKVEALIREWRASGQFSLSQDRTVGPSFDLRDYGAELKSRILSLLEEQVREEREQCAKLVEAKRIGAWLNEVADYDVLPEIARAIRSRGEGR